MVDNFNPRRGFNNVATAVAEEGAVDSDALLSHLRKDLDLMIQVMLQDGVGVHEVSFKVLLENLDVFGLLEGLKSHSFRLDLCGDIGEVEITGALRESHGPGVLDDGELIGIDSEGQADWLVN